MSSMSSRINQGWMPGPTRREAIARAAEAFVRLRPYAEAREEAQGKVQIVNDPRVLDGEAWESVDALEDMVVTRGLAARAEIEGAGQRTNLRVLMGD